MTDAPAPRCALITGASSGIGAAFARHLAGQGYRLVLVARDRVRLDAAVPALLAAGAAAVEVLAADLTDPPQRDSVRSRLADPERPVELLVNCAGIGLGRSFGDVTDTELLEQLELNVTAVLLLTWSALPGMRARGQGAVINVASVAGLVPNPGASYAASKAWVVAFSEGLAMTLRGTGVRVQALCPGLVRSGFHQRAGINLDRTPAISFIDVDRLVAASLADLRRGVVVSVHGALYQGAVVIARLLPRRLVRALSARAYAAQRR